MMPRSTHGQIRVIHKVFKSLRHLGNNFKMKVNAKKISQGSNAVAETNLQLPCFKLPDLVGCGSLGPTSGEGVATLTISKKMTLLMQC
eukprot:6111145-Amphidinium_carterae.1